MDLSMLVNKKMDLEKDLVKLLMLMGVFTMENGQMTRNTEMVNTSIWIKLNTMESGKRIREKDMERINTQMEIVMKVTGTMIFKME